MRFQQILFAILGILSSVGQANAAIFGDDTRAPITPVSSAYLLSHSTAVAVLSSNKKVNPKGLFNLEVDSLSDHFCSDEKFANEPSLSYACTGFLVARDLIMTAGHCMVNAGEARNQSEGYCEAFSWLFDYTADASGTTKLTDIDPNKFYECKKIIYAVREESPPFRDFALVQLKRPVDREAISLSRQPLKPNEILSMIGYPLGMPAQYSSRARVLKDDVSQQGFIANLDAFDGNSGSPVFNSDNQVVGILVGGTPVEMFRKDPEQECYRYNKCDESGLVCDVPDKDLSKLPEFQRTGSIVQRIEPLIELLDQWWTHSLTDVERILEI